MNTFKSNLIDLFTFIKRPKEEAHSNQNIWFKISKLFQVLVIDFIILFFISFLVHLVEVSGLVDTSGHKIEEIMRSSSVFYILFATVIIAPLFEEFFFRVYLRYQRNYLLRGIVGLFGIFGTENKEKVDTFVRRNWTKYYRYVFYFSAILFAFVHISNFKFSYALLLFSPILVAPQLLIGLFLGYFRVRHGFMWGVYFHAAHNLLAVGLSLLLYSNSVQDINIKNNNYILEVNTNRPFVNIDDNHTFFSDDSIVFKHVELKKILSDLYGKEVRTIKIDNINISDISANLLFVKSSDSINTKQTIIDAFCKANKIKAIHWENQQEVYKLVVKDTALLKSHILTNSLQKGILRDDSYGRIKMVNISLVDFVASINLTFEELLIADSYNVENLKFDIKESSFKEINKILKEEYGISFEQTKDTVEYITLVSK